MNLAGFINDNIQGMPNYNAIGTAINNNINDKPTYGAISEAINDYVNSDKPATNWGKLAMNTLGGMTPIQPRQTQTPNVIFHPSMMQPQYVNTNFQNQKSNIAKTNLYDYLMR